MNFIRQHRTEFTVARMCWVLGVTEGGYYRWLKRPPSGRTLEDQRLGEEVERIYSESRKRYGSPKILHEMRKIGFRCGHKRVERLMRARSLRSIVSRKRKPWTGSVKPVEAAANLLNREFSTAAPNLAWVTDITYIRAASGWLFLCAILDLYSRKIVGWAVSSKADTSLVLAALRMACEREKPGKGLIVHSDRGTQYGSKEFRKELGDRGFKQSMSRKGDCWDNACMESFFRLIKVEELNQIKIEGIGHLHGVVRWYIEIFYNRIRIHSTLGYLSPVQFEKKYCA